MRALLVVTGGSAGLGRALLAAAPAGTHRVDVSRSGPPPEADEHLAVDLAAPEGWAAAGDAVAGRVDAGRWDRVTLIHSAGTIAPVGFAGEVDPATYTANLLLNAAAGPAIGARFLTAVARLGIPRELALISSGAARSAYAGWSAYGAGKAAGDQWVRAVGEEQRRRGGVRVLGIAPGVVATGMQATIRATDPDDFPAVERFRRLHADGELLDADEVAGRIWGVLDDQQVATGTVLDLRDR